MKLKQPLPSLIFNKKILVLVVLLTLIFTRLYNLRWGLPFLFHPDENNMTYAISQLTCNLNKISFINNLKDCFNPNFYAYGQFPLYLAKLLSNLFNSTSLQTYALSLRMISAFCSIISGIVLYRIIIKKTSFKWAYLSLVIYIFTPGLIQLSYFGTTESIIILLILVLINLRANHLSLSALISGIGIATKVSFMPYSLIPLLFLWLKNGSVLLKKYTFLQTLKYLLFMFLFAIIFSPHNLINYNDFIRSLSYESGVAAGHILVFYTRQFLYTSPIIFQITNILSYSLGFPLMILGVASFVVLIIKRKFEYPLILTLLTISTVFLYVKWTRFISHTYPIFIILSVLLLFYLNKKFRLISYFIVFTLLLFQTIFGIDFMKIYFKNDTRIEASNWINNSIKSKSNILTESANVLDIPIYNNNSFNIRSLFLYNIDSDQQLSNLTFKLLKTSDYVIVPSRRVFMNHTCYTSETGSIIRKENSNCLKKEIIYPKITKYYNTLFGPNYKLVKTISPFLPNKNLFIFHQNSEKAEETWSVFDHPTIRIYKNLRTI